MATGEKLAVTAATTTTWPARLERLWRLRDRISPGGRKIAASMIWMLAGQVVAMAVSLLVGVYVARYLGPGQFGVLSYAISLAWLFSALSRLGLESLVVRDLVTHPEAETEILGTAFVLRLLGGVVAFGLMAAASLAMGEDRTTTLAILIIGLGLAFQAFGVPSGWFQAQLNARPVVIARLLALALSAGLKLLFIALEKPVLWFAVPAMVDLAAASGFAILAYLRLGRPLLRWRFSMVWARDLMGRAWPLALSLIVTEAYMRVDQIMLGHMAGTWEVGWYAAAARLSQALYLLPTIICTAVFPAIVRAWNTSDTLYRQRMQALYDLIFWGAVAVALPIALLSHWIIGLLYGPAYAPAGTVLQIHAWSLVLVSLGVARSRALLAERLQTFFIPISVCSLVLNVTGNAVLIPELGAVGAAWATILAQIVSVILINGCHPRTWPAVRMMIRAPLAPIRLLRSGIA